MAVNVRNAIGALTSQMQGAQKQVAFATRVALTRTAQKAVPAVQHEMRDVFRNPTPYTLSALRVVPATKSRLTATVMLKDDATKATPASKYLLPQIKGGQRGQKRFERALQAVGAMPTGYRAVPGSGARLDSFGNMSRGQIVQLLAYFRAFPEAGYKANMTPESRARLARGSKRKQGYAYFVGRPGNRLPLGIYQRFNFAFGSSIKPVLLFVRSAVYTERFDMEYVVQKTVEKEFAGEFTRAMVEAERTAR